MTKHDQEYLSYYRKMVTIRQFETLAGELFAASKIPGFIHLSIGQEASAMGVCSCLVPGRRRSESGRPALSIPGSLVHSHTRAQGRGAQ